MRIKIYGNDPIAIFRAAVTDRGGVRDGTRSANVRLQAAGVETKRSAAHEGPLDRRPCARLRDWLTDGLSE